MIAIRCILEREVSNIIPDPLHMEGKSLAMAYLGDAPHSDDSDSGDKIVSIDFGGGAAKPSSPKPSAGEPLFAPLDIFLAGDNGFQWHEPGKGLSAVRSILKKLRGGAKVAPPTDLGIPGFGDDDDEDELAGGVQMDLEDLEQILIAADKARTRFYLAFDT